jgi:RNA polymerase sigma-70 factor (ECF subfamily)
MAKKLDEKFSPKFDEIYKELQPKILGFICARVNSVEDAEDISADVFIKVYNNLADFKWQGVSINAWIYRIAKNAIIDYYRKVDKNKRKVDFDSISDKIKDSSPDILTNLLDDEEKRSLYMAISELDFEDQYLIYYKYFEELSLEEIAKRMRLSETNVGTRLHRLRRKLLKSFKQKHAKKSKK